MHVSSRTWARQPSGRLAGIRTGWRAGIRVFSDRSSAPSCLVYDGVHPRRPLATLGPAPGDGVGQRQQRFLPSVQMLVPDRVPAAELERAREENAVVGPHEGIVAVEDEPTAMLCIRMTREAHT